MTISQAPHPSQHPTRAVKTALVGYGHLGKWHAKKCEGLKSCDLVGIVELDEMARAKALKAYPHVQVVGDLDQILDQVEALVIVTPTSTHYSLVKKGLEEGKHIFCEKPLCQFFFEAEELSSLVKESKLVIQVGHSEQFQEAWSLIANSPILKGKKGAIQVNRFGPFQGRVTDVDVVQDLMPHDLDLLLHVLKEKPVRIHARGFKVRTDHWDHVNCHLTLESGWEAHMTVGRCHVFEQRSWEFINQQGCLYIDLGRYETLIALGNKTKNEDSINSNVERIPYEKRDILLKEQQEFYHCIQHNKRPQVSLDEGKEVVFYFNKILEAIESNEVINL